MSILVCVLFLLCYTYYVMYIVVLFDMYVGILYFCLFVLFYYILSLFPYLVGVVLYSSCIVFLVISHIIYLTIIFFLICWDSCIIIIRVCGLLCEYIFLSIYMIIFLYI